MKRVRKQIMSSKNLSDYKYTNGEERYLNLQIKIIDTGIGISEEGIEKLFVNFGKLQENQNRNKGGTGLGLSICK